jgi:hypothetical protein
MSRLLIKVSLLTIVLSVFAGAIAAPAAVAAAEIAYLLRTVSGSSCEFYRNGRWYGAAEAEVHLREKFKLLSSAEQISTAEEFIDKVASRSSLTGRAYQVRCQGNAPVPTSEWLLDVLARYRAKSVTSPEAR